jgi:hypothetical protein
MSTPDDDTAAIAEAIRRLPDTVLEEALYAAVTAAIKDRRDAVTKVRKANMAAINITALDVKLPDGTKVAGITDSGTKQEAKIADQAAFVRWVAKHFPAEIMQAVRPAWQKKFLDDLAASGEAEWADDQGEIHEVAGVDIETVEGRSSLRFTTGGADLMAQAWRLGLLDHLNLAPILAIGQSADGTTAA